jgi:hypothetical protein
MCANRVPLERSFMSSGEPKISDAVRPSTASAAVTQAVSRGPRTGWRKYASASARLLIAYRRDIVL